MDQSIRLYVGVDWATEDHVARAVSPAGEVVGDRSFKHSGDGLADLVKWIVGLSDGRLDQVAVAIEIPHGAIVETLLEYGCQVFAINPKQLDRFRDRFSPAGAKDDRRDAYVLADSLRTDQHCFRRLKSDDPLTIELREWSRIHDELAQEKVRDTNRLRAQLRRYFPQYLELGGDAVGNAWFLELWNRVPTPADAKRVRAAAVTKILKEHRIRRVTAAAVLKALRTKPLPVAPGTERAAVAHIRLVVERLQVTNRQIRQCQGALDELLGQFCQPDPEAPAGEKGEQRSDAQILLSFPGVGRIVLATLLAEAADPLRQRDYHVLRALSGVAPVTVRSGKSRRVVMRQACHHRLRTACYHWARIAVQCDAVSREIYARARARGHTHARALRKIADRLLLIACSMLRHRTLYDPTRSATTAAHAVPA